MSATAYVSNDANDYAALGPNGATATADYTFFRWLDDTSAVDHARVITTEREGGDGQDRGLAYVEHHTGKAAISGYARADMLVHALGYILGTGSITGASAMPHVHDLWPVNQARLLNYEGAAPGQTIIEKMIESKIGQLVIAGEHGKPIKVTAQITGGDSPQQISVASARTVSYETSDPWYFNQGSYRVAVAGSLQADDDITKWTVTITRNQDEDVFGVGYGRKGITDLNRDIQVEVTRKYENATAHNAVLYAGGSTVSVGVATGAFDIYLTNGLVGTALRDAKIALPLIVWEPITRNAFENDGNTVYEDLTGAALKARGGTHIITAQISAALATAVASGLR